MKQSLSILILLNLYVFATVPIKAQQNVPKHKKDNESNSASIGARAKFEPAGEQCLVFAGQSLSAIGGLDQYNDGYMDHFDKPAGFTMYTNLRPGDVSFGHTYDGNDGMVDTDDWGDGPNNMSMQISDPDFDGLALAIGLELVNHEIACANGDRDQQIEFLGRFVKSLGTRPVFLRIGYEFDGHPWNHYDRESYIKSFSTNSQKI